MSDALAAFAVAASALLWAATAVAWAARQGAFAEAWRGWADGSRLRKALSLAALAALVSWAGTKPEGEIIELSNNRIIESVEAAGGDFNAKNAKGNNAKSAKTVGSRNAPQKAQLSEGRLRSNGEAARKSPLPRDLHATARADCEPARSQCILAHSSLRTSSLLSLFCF